MGNLTAAKLVWTERFVTLNATLKSDFNSNIIPNKKQTYLLVFTLANLPGSTFMDILEVSKCITDQTGATVWIVAQDC